VKEEKNPELIKFQARFGMHSLLNPARREIKAEISPKKKEN
jgi:hypothetical protein